MVLSEFYLTIMNKLIAANIGIQFIDLFNDQFNQEEEELPFNVPAVFLEYEPFIWRTLGGKRKEADVTFNLHVCSEMIYLETNNIEQTVDRNNGLKHLQLLDKIGYHLHAFSGALAPTPDFGGGSFGSIQPAGIVPDQNHGSVVIHVMQFNTRITDDSGMRPKVKKSLTVEIEPHIGLPPTE